MKRSILGLAAVMGLLCGSAMALDFTVGFTGCPASPIEDTTAGKDVKFTLTGTLTTANNESPDGAQGWSYGVAVTNGEFENFDTTITIPTLFGTTLVEKDLDLDNAGFWSAELLPLEGSPKTGFTTGIVFSTSKKQVLHPVGTVETVHLYVKANMPAAEGEKEVSVNYQAGLQGSGQPVDNVVTFNSESFTPGIQGCNVTLKVPPIPPPEFFLALARNGQDPAAEGDTDYTEKVTKDAAEALVAVPIQVVLSSKNILEGEVPADGPQGWSLSITGDNAAGVWSNPDVCGLHVSTIFEKVKGSPDYDYDFDLCDAAFNETAVTVDGKGVLSAIVPSTSKKQVLQANHTDRILNFDYALPVADAAVTAKLFFQDGGQGAGQPVNNVVTYNTASKIATYQALNLTIEPIEEKNPDTFVRGDPNADGKKDIADPIYIVYAVVPGLDSDGSYQIKCRDASDANDDEKVDLADAIYLIDYQFRGGPAPTAPFPDCGVDDDATVESCPPDSIVCQ